MLQLIYEINIDKINFTIQYDGQTIEMTRISNMYKDQTPKSKHQQRSTNADSMNN